MIGARAETRVGPKPPRSEELLTYLPNAEACDPHHGRSGEYLQGLGEEPESPDPSLDSLKARGEEREVHEGGNARAERETPEA